MKLYLLLLLSAITITNLMSYTSYAFTVLGIHEFGNGKAAMINVTTAPGADGSEGTTLCM